MVDGQWIVSVLRPIADPSYHLWLAAEARYGQGANHSLSPGGYRARLWKVPL